jgi:hypothetical protein
LMVRKSARSVRFCTASSFSAVTLPAMDILQAAGARAGQSRENLGSAGGAQVQAYCGLQGGYRGDKTARAR